MNTLTLQGFTYTELFEPEGLNKLDAAFFTFLAENDPDSATALLAYRQHTSTLSLIETSEMLIRIATYLETFLANLFGIQAALSISSVLTVANNPLAVFKKYFILKRAKKDLSKSAPLASFAELNAWLKERLSQQALQTDDLELAVGLFGVSLLNQAEEEADAIEKLVQWCVRALTTAEGQALIGNWSSFDIPERLDFQHLVATTQTLGPISKLEQLDGRFRERDGFKLTDPRMDRREVQDQVNYCIYCHDHDGDFCSKGFPVKKGDPAQGFKKNPLDLILTGCPLEEKISEMHFLKRDGRTLAALAMVMVDNPLCPATGHRICNDCMKACIYQKQDPVNIPQIETRVLTDVLDLPWGVEIYDLLTRWNPLRQTQYCLKPYNGLKVLIAGMGPAGFTLAHHLLLEGFAVVGFDGLKIEPLTFDVNQPIERFTDLKEALDERVMSGFGGVAEYGITVRWDKNFLKLIYLSLVRRKHFQVFGSVRLGGTITVEDAWRLGFDHFALAVGAGLPKALSIPASMAPGMRQANDFLMALQLGNAAKPSSLTNLQVRLPAVVIGGGLTGVDTATEVQAYYVTQVEKIAARYAALCATDTTWLTTLDPASLAILQEYLAHAALLQAERKLAQEEKRPVNFIPLLRQFGGVTIAYRKTMQESPAYIYNHEELQKALEEGIYYAENLEPKAVNLDSFGHAESLTCARRKTDGAAHGEGTPSIEETVTVPARSILVATGTQPNTAYEFEHRGTFHRVNLQYQHYEDQAGELVVAHGVTHCKDPAFGPFTSYQKEDRRVSLIGDTHPVFHGNVVKAIASGMRTYPKILALLQERLHQLGDSAEYAAFNARMRDLFSNTVTQVTRKTPTVVELRIRAPLAAAQFRAGQFFRLQNFETRAPLVANTRLQMEPLAIVAADVRNEELTFLIEENSTAAKLCALLQPGEPVSLMGPTGVRAKISGEHETILIVGEVSSFAFLRAYGSALKAAGNRVLYVLEAATQADIYCQAELEAASDVIIWAFNDSQAFDLRTNDFRASSANCITALLEYHARANTIALADIDRAFVIGSPALLKRFQAARKVELKSLLSKDPSVVGSVYGNMQCMLKGVCAQCLQWQIDPETGLRTKAVFACSWQDEPLEIIDIEHLLARKAQNHLQEAISSRWLDSILHSTDLARA